uniref:Tetratricopeptide TPR_2 repeat protein n=1 Tax=Solibacter usitatus (strain Ellin6076) TaxID=234267 RepID=Q025F1_SOLUE
MLVAGITGLVGVMWLSAQIPLADRLLAAGTPQGVEEILNAAPGEVTHDVFTACRNAAQATLERGSPAALKQFQTALAVAERVNSPADVAAALLGVGISQSRQNQNIASLTTFDKGYPLAVQAGDQALQAHYLRARGVAYSTLGRFAEGLAENARSLALYREIKDNRGASFVLSNTCAAHRVMGDLRRAAAECEEAYQLSKGLTDGVAAGVGLGNLGPVAAEQGNFAAAREYLEESIRLHQEKGDLRLLGTSLLNIGPVYKGLGEYEKAFAAYERAVALTAQVNDFSGRSMALFNRAALYTSLHRYDEALKDLREGLAQREKFDSKYQTGYGLVNISRLESYLGDTDGGCRDAEQALEIGRQYQSGHLTWAALNARGVCEMKRKNIAKAREMLEGAVAQIESVRGLAGGGDQTGQSFMTDKIEPYHNLLRVQLELGQPEQAFATAERARARQLVDAVRRGKTQTVLSMTAEEQREEKRLGDALARLDGRVAASSGAAKTEALAAWDKAKRDFEAFRAHLYAVHPELEARRGEAPPLTIAETADLLPDAGTVAIEFAVLNNSIRIFTVEHGADGKPSLKTHTVEWDRDALGKDVLAFREQLANRDLEYRTAAAALYRKLLGPAAAELRGKSTIVVVPDGVLWNLPFQALVRPDGAHLLERQTVFYAPSLTFLRQDRRSGGPAGRELLAMGNPGAANLPNAAREVQTLAKLYDAGGALALTGAAATKDAWLRDAPNYRLLHLATHGVLNPANPMYSWLALAPGAKDASDDALEAREIVAMNLHADLAVLSACDTGRGLVMAGEGLVGMSWAFLAAGTRTTVVSQWKVESASTTDMMLAFHRNLKQEMGRARSLQRAMVATMRTPERRHPYYWAGFVMIGNGY